MQHDIYSIGVVLLEIGLWTSLVSYPQKPNQNPESDAPVASDLITLLSPTEERDPRLRAFRGKEMLEDLAERELPHRLGEKYTNMVLTCLRCLDDPGASGSVNKAGGVPSSKDTDGLGIGVSFVETVLGLVHEISL